MSIILQFLFVVGTCLMNFRASQRKNYNIFRGVVKKLQKTDKVVNG